MMQETNNQKRTGLDEFIDKVKKVSSHRVHRVNNSVGVYSAYKTIRKNHWYNIGRPLTEKEFYSIIRTTNKLIAEELSNGNDFTLPCRMGILEIRKYQPSITIKNGKVKENLPVDWDKTFKLWYEDEEAYNNRFLVKRHIKEMFRLIYNKTKADYTNKTFYEFKFNRKIKINLKNNIKEGIIDAFPLSKD